MQQKPLPSIDLESIEKAGSITNYLIWKKYRYWTFGVIAVFVLESYYFHTAYTFILFMGYFFTLQRRAEEMFIQYFAKINGMEYKYSDSVDSVAGHLFKTGEDRDIEHVISTTYMDHPLRLFYYTYSVKVGKNKVANNFTVAEITFPKVAFPHILLQTRTMRRYGAKGPNEKQISLEGDFGKDLILYATEGYEIEIFQIFTPEVMQFLREKGKHFSIEFAEDKLYIYDDLRITKKKQLQDMYEVTKKIFDLTGALLGRLHDDFEALHPYYQKK
jgi:hypothetical protein